jgi:hypothetical protein
VLLVGHADDPAEMALGMDPAQGVLENVELSSETITVSVRRHAEISATPKPM